MGRTLHRFGLLPRDHTEITSATDLTGEYIGQTKERVRKTMEAARGGVLFIDEAYELGAASNQYSTEAMTTLLGMLTEDEFADGNTLVILAGYEEQMDAMMARNPGLKSRFTERLHFDDWDSLHPIRCRASREEREAVSVFD